MNFNSGLAYLYQLSQPIEDWADLASPEAILKLLEDSASSNSLIDWGNANLPADLRQAIADWANDTLADQVASTARHAMQLQGIRGGESFSISEVESFTRTFTRDTAIGWIIRSKDKLPRPSTNKRNALPTVEIQIGESSQVMIVAVDLPFRSDTEILPTVPSIGARPALVDHVNVTVRYPASQDGLTYTFLSNGSQTFSAPYDARAGSNWGLDYEVIYVETNVTVTGAIQEIKQSTYTLELKDAGILSVAFDASHAFATETAKPTAIEIALGYTGAGGVLIQQTVTINQTVELSALRRR